MARKRKQIRRWVRLHDDFIYSDLNRGIMCQDNGPLIMMTYLTLCMMADEASGILYDITAGRKQPFHAKCLVRLYPRYSEKQFSGAINTLTDYGFLEPMADGGYILRGFRELKGHETWEAREARFRKLGACYLPWEKEAEKAKETAAMAVSERTAPCNHEPEAAQRSGNVEESPDGQTERETDLQEVGKAVLTLSRWVYQNCPSDFRE